MGFTPVFSTIPKNVVEWARYLRSIRRENGDISDAELRDSAPYSVIGRASGSAGSPADVSASANDTILRRVSDALGFGQLTAGMAPNSLWPYAKIQNVSATDVLLGRSSSGAGVIEEIVCTAAGRALLDDASASDQRTTLGLGTAATQNTGTSGATVPLLNGTNVHQSGQFTAFGVGTTATQQAANPDTSGATLGQLETEVNQLKAVLRTFGLIAT